MARRVRPRYGRICAAAASLVTTLVTLLAGAGLMGSQASATASPGADRVSLVDSSAPQSASEDARTSATPALPGASGSGRRVVFDISAQRVWLVATDGHVVRSYLVSGSVSDNLHPGSYAVYSRSRYATGIDDSGQMQFFVRFAHGEHAAIGFHSIPTQDGRPVQTLAQLGTPLSHGCIRQAKPDARRLWNFAPVGTPVVVTA